MLSVGGKFAAAHIGAITNDTVHLGVIAHSPLYAEHSVGKLQLLLLARHLAGEGFKTFDLTPGDDPWKERFADAHDDVIELRMYPNAMARVRAMAPRQLLALAKRAAGVVAGEETSCTAGPGRHDGRVGQHRAVERVQRGSHWLRLSRWPGSHPSEWAVRHHRHIERIRSCPWRRPARTGWNREGTGAAAGNEWSTQRTIGIPGVQNPAGR